MEDEARKRLALIVAKAKGDRSARQLAIDLGVSQGTVQNWLRGIGFPDSQNLEKIAVAAGMTVEELFNQIRGEDAARTPRVAEDVLQIARQLDKRQRKRLIKLLVDEL